MSLIIIIIMIIIMIIIIIIMIIIIMRFYLNRLKIIALARIFLMI
jgi:hypothetical protein